MEKGRCACLNISPSIKSMTFSSFSKKIIILEYKKVRQLTEDIDLLLRYDTFAHVFKSSLSKSNNSQICWLIFNMLMIVKTMWALPLNYIELFITIIYAVFRKALRTLYVSLYIFICVCVHTYVCVFLYIHDGCWWLQISWKHNRVKVKDWKNCSSVCFSA